MSGQQPALITDGPGGAHAKGSTYSFEWSSETDVFHVRDSKGRTILAGPLQPMVTVQAAGDAARVCESGRIGSSVVTENRLSVRYDGVSRGWSLSVTVRFDADCFWVEPLTYETSERDDVVSVHYYARATSNTAGPGLAHTYLVQPGICESSALGPVVPTNIGLDLTSWLGRGSMGPDSQIFQQWGLPTHYFCGVTRNSEENETGALTEHLSDAFCCGLADLPTADLLIHMKEGLCSPVLNVRSDLWGHVRGPGRMAVGPTFVWTFARTYDQAISRYYRTLVETGIVEVKRNSAAKNAVVTAAQFNTWGAQCAETRTWWRFDQGMLESIYDDMKRADMKPGVFVVDAKWEGTYGLLEHDEERFPNFEVFLDRVRDDGHKIGMWAAFLRTDDPASVGLEDRHLVLDRDGTPLVKRNLADRPFFLFDVSQDEVCSALRDRIKAFARRYRPDLVKFDFGYELPSLSVSAPANRDYAGEALLRRGLDLVVGALREINPDVVVMYYSLSPLLAGHIDLHSPDDLFACVEDYDREANRRFFFSRILGELGMPTYGSGGYDWGTMREIWFDSVAVGNVGSLGSFTGDEHDQSVTPELVSKYNGLARIARSSNLFTVNPLDPVRLGGSGGARSSSWARFEDDELVLVALRGRVHSGSTGGAVALPVTATAPVVVASFSDASLTAASALGVVAFGDGELVVERVEGFRSAEAIAHTLGGGRIAWPVRTDGGHLRLELGEQVADGRWIEWIEVRVDERASPTS